MPRLVLGVPFAVLLLLATPLLAQPADLGVTLAGVPERALPGTTFQWSATFNNHGRNAVSVPNGRGILVDVPSLAVHHQNGPWQIRNNVISGNLRSGSGWRTAGSWR